MIYQTARVGTDFDQKTLIPALKLLRSRRAKDPRDKVYVAFGLAHSEEQTPVDYGMVVGTVYTDIIRKSVEVLGTFQILGYRR